MEGIKLSTMRRGTDTEFTERHLQTSYTKSVVLITKDKSYKHESCQTFYDQPKTLRESPQVNNPKIQMQEAI